MKVEQSNFFFYPFKYFEENLLKWNKHGQTIIGQYTNKHLT